jgi:hypothetical protein
VRVYHDSRKPTVGEVIVVGLFGAALLSFAETFKEKQLREGAREDARERRRLGTQNREG